MAITTTAGGSGIYALGATTGAVTLFTTPNVTDAIFIVTLLESTTSASSVMTNKVKVVVGPNTAYKIYDAATKSGALSWNWTQVVIS